MFRHGRDDHAIEIVRPDAMDRVRCMLETQMTDLAPMSSRSGGAGNAAF